MVSVSRDQGHRHHERERPQQDALGKIGLGAGGGAMAHDVDSRNR
jgi:hypothetical protein